MMRVSIADAQERLSTLVQAASSRHERFEVTHNGARAAVILGAGDYDSLIETIDVLADDDVVRELRQSLADLGSGASVSGEEMRDRLRAAGRLKP